MFRENMQERSKWNGNKEGVEMHVFLRKEDTERDERKRRSCYKEEREERIQSERRKKSVCDLGRYAFG